MSNQLKVIASWDIPTDIPFTKEFLGGKALGLLKIPREWTPPFLVLTANFYKAWKTFRAAKPILDNLNEKEKSYLDAIIKKASILSDLLYIRSNAPEEDIRLRGQHQTLFTKNNLRDISITIDQLLSTEATDNMLLIVQPIITPGIWGHMSNERRVSKNKNRWIIEYEMEEKPAQEIINVVAAEHYSKLYSPNEKFVTGLKKAASKLITINSGIFHCEWVYDGIAVWIVQADEIIYQQSEANANAELKKNTGKIPEIINFQLFKHFEKANSFSWKKLRAPLLFSKIGIPVAHVYLLTGYEWSDSENNLTLIKEDLNTALKTAPLIIRCDISKSVTRDDLLLQTSGNIETVQQALDFMAKVFEENSKNNLAPNEWTFLIAFKVNIQASAFVQAFPQGQRVRIDTLWGYPDGLLYYPHDTWYYYTGSNKIKKDVNYKDICLLPATDGWRDYRLDPPMDWESVLNKSEAVTLANWAIKVANEVNKEIQLMAFVKVNNVAGPKGCFPWHYTELKISSYQSSIKSSPFFNKIARIETREDLVKFSTEKNIGVAGLLLIPKYELIRDAGFLEEVAAAAVKANKAIYFEGSLLGHAYYILTKSGANVIPVSEEEPKEKKITYNKLVRDKIPLVVKEAGGIARVRRLSNQESLVLLSQKLIEEAFEVWNSNPDELVGELADVVEVIEAIAKFSNVPLTEIDRIKTSKKHKRGGFENMVFLEETEIRPFKSLTKRDGTLPLFINESNGSKSKKSNPKFEVIKLMETETEESIKLKLPLVPQVKTEDKSPFIESNFPYHKVKINYNGNYLIIEIIKTKKTDFDHPPNQLRLF